MSGGKDRRRPPMPLRLECGTCSWKAFTLLQLANHEKVHLLDWASRVRKLTPAQMENRYRWEQMHRMTVEARAKKAAPHEEGPPRG